MRPGDAVTEAVTGAVGAALDELMVAARLLRARGAANRFTSGFEAYYGSTVRQDDVARLGMARLLSKRANESWLEYEERIRAFVGLEVWAGTRTSFCVTGDVSQWGTVTGIVRELERTGLHVETFYTVREDPLAWRMSPMGDRGTDDSMILAVGEEFPPGQRLTRIYSIGDSLWGFWIVLTNPNEVEYLADEVRTIVRDVKPAWARCYLLLPEASEWEVVD